MNENGTGNGNLNRRRRVVTGVIGHDVHAVANKLMILELNENGYDVLNLGVDVSPQTFVDAALEYGADAVLVSSLNGEGETWCRGFRDRFEDAGIEDIVLYAGGNLVVGNLEPHEIERVFSGYGFDRVFHRPKDFKSLISALENDLGA